MKSQKMLWPLLLIALLLVLLSIWWSDLRPSISIVFLILIVLAIRNGWLYRMLEKLREMLHPPVVYYRPTEQPPQSPEQSLSIHSPEIGFELKPSEYLDLSEQYQRGYQAQAPRRKNTHVSSDAQPKWGDYDEQPQAYYPEQRPPLIQ